ncbi:MAG TPA: hypothetical protein VFI27_16320 [candidate division Zixibacteria bacterium]|nr:hypothetical protein [candidate division Zixibacteria bacterium]
MSKNAIEIERLVEGPSSISIYLYITKDTVVLSSRWPVNVR